MTELLNSDFRNKLNIKINDSYVVATANVSPTIFKYFTISGELRQFTFSGKTIADQIVEKYE